MANLAIMLAAGGLFLLGLAALVYVAFRFLSLVLSMEVGILKEFKQQRPAVEKALSDIPQKESKLKEFIQSRFTPSEGEYVPYSEEEAFIQEKVEDLRRQGLSQEELDAFVRQAVGTDVGNE